MKIYYLVNWSYYLEFWFSQRNTYCRCNCSNSFIIIKYRVKKILKTVANLKKNKCFDNRL